MKPSTLLIRKKVVERIVMSDALNLEAEQQTAEACGVSLLRVQRARIGKDPVSQLTRERRNDGHG